MRKHLKQSNPSKALIGWSVFFAIVASKAAHIGVFQHTYWSSIAEKNQQISKLTPAPRGEVYDRFGVKLIENRPAYEAAVYYQGFIHLSKKRRLEAIGNLSKRVGRLLGIDVFELEDEIHAKASQNLHVPFVIKTDLTQSEYYKLKAIEKDIPGLIVHETYKRRYPNKKLLSHVLGYLGSIDEAEYRVALSELNHLRSLNKLIAEGLTPALPPEIDSHTSLKQAICKLQSKVASFSDLTGKAGVEKSYDHVLRGVKGKEIYDVDSRGYWQYKHSESAPAIPGKSIYLTISSELQKHAEHLLIENEALRRGKSSYFNSKKKATLPLKEPWIKGGAIVALDPKTGEVLALASHPRFDPNDFIHPSGPFQLIQSASNPKVHKWLESERYIAKLWDQKAPLEKDVTLGNEIKNDPIFVTWEFFLNRILSGQSSLRSSLEQNPTLGSCLPILSAAYDAAASMELSLQELTELPPSEIPKGPLQNTFEKLHTPYNRRLFLDLIRLSSGLADAKSLSSIDYQPFYSRTHSEHFQDTKNYLLVAEFAKEAAKKVFHAHVFEPWKRQNQLAFLKEKRTEEKKLSKYARPYTVYLKEQERKLFEIFWSEHKRELVCYFLHSTPTFDELLVKYYRELDTWKKELFEGAHNALNVSAAHRRLSHFLDSLPYASAKAYLKTLKSYDELVEPLVGTYPNTRSSELKNLAALLYPPYGFGFMTHKAYQVASAPGSIFKLVPSYASLMQKARTSDTSLNPLTLIDEHEKKPGGRGFISVAKKSSGERYPRIYKEGRLIQSARKSIGKIDLAEALAQTSNPYFSILCKDHLEAPSDLIEAAKTLGFAASTGLDLPYEAEGRLPSDVESNPSGLYAAAIGQHTVQATAIQVAEMLCKIATRQTVRPFVVSYTQGLEKSPLRLAHSQNHYLYKPYLERVAIDFPLIIGKEKLEEETQLTKLECKPFDIPQAVQEMLFNGMKKVTQSPSGTAYYKNIHLYPQKHEALEAYKELYPYIIGKTSTAEVIETLSLEQEERGKVYKNVWFGGILFEDAECKSNPELVVVVFLPYGAGGKDPAPLMASVAKKWREIKARN